MVVRWHDGFQRRAIFPIVPAPQSQPASFRPLGQGTRLKRHSRRPRSRRTRDVAVIVGAVVVFSSRQHSIVTHETGAAPLGSKTQSRFQIDPSRDDFSHERASDVVFVGRPVAPARLVQAFRGLLALLRRELPVAFAETVGMEGAVDPIALLDGLERAGTVEAAF